MLIRGFLVALCAALAMCAPAAQAWTPIPQTIRVCGDTNEFAPYIYRERHGAARGPGLVGLDVDVLERILVPAGYQVRIDLLPWARCLLLGARGDYPIILDGLKSPKRERDFLFPSSHYGLTPVFVYLRKGPRPLTGSVEQLSRYRLCSQADYNYEPFGVPERMITNRARTLDDAATMLKLGRCQVLLQYVEILQANYALGGADVLGDPAFDSDPARWIPRVDLYFMVSKNAPYREPLVSLLDRGIQRLKRDGELDRMRAKYQNR